MLASIIRMVILTNWIDRPKQGEIGLNTCIRYGEGHVAMENSFAHFVIARSYLTGVFSACHSSQADLDIEKGNG